MASHRCFIIWLLLVGIVGVYARNYEELSSDDLQLDEDSSISNTADEDFASVEDVIAQLNKVRLYKRSDPTPSTSKMSQSDIDWHFREGLKTLKRMSEATDKFQAENEIWKKRRAEDRRRAAVERENDRRKEIASRKTNKGTQTHPQHPSGQ